MELTELTNNFTQILQIQNIIEAPHKIMQVLFSCKEKVFDDWLNFCPDLSADYLQPIFQYYMADRKDKMQDYTPKTLAKACIKLAKIETANSCYDMCAGSGALTIQAWCINPNCFFTCEELDERVIPFLIFNLAIRNCDALIINGNILSGEKKKAYRLTHNEKYSDISETEIQEEIKTDVCISNPPYNLKWQHEPFMKLDKRFCDYGVPPESNANYAFILTALNTAKRSVLILPKGIIDCINKIEKGIKQFLVERNKIDGIILNPDNMFEATNIGTLLLCVDNDKKDTLTAFIDMRHSFKEETREQKGQYGGKSHTNRTYEKTIKVYTDEHINNMVEAVFERKGKAEFSKSASIEDIKEQEYVLNPSSYIDFIEKEPKHRDYIDIVNDLNRVISERNFCKLTINETLAKRLGFELELYRNSNDDELNSTIQKITGTKLVKSDYISFTKNKNELSFKNTSPENISTILLSILQMWKQHIMYLNNEEKRLLIEMRDALLPELMNGKISL